MSLLTRRAATADARRRAPPCDWAAPPMRRPTSSTSWRTIMPSHAISAYGSKVNRTPNIDRIAQQGVRFDNCFCTNSICTPSRAVILTGPVQPHERRQHARRRARSARARTSPSCCKAPATRPAIVGKWHLQKRSDRLRLLEHPARPGRLPRPGVHRDGQAQRSATGYCTDLIADYSLDWLKQRDKDKPFFLMCHHKAPHRPWQPDAKYARHVRRRDDSRAGQPVRPLREPLEAGGQCDAARSART